MFPLIPPSEHTAFFLHNPAQNPICFSVWPRGLLFRNKTAIFQALTVHLLACLALLFMLNRHIPFRHFLHHFVYYLLLGYND
jgi:hypothetical protein